MKTDFPRYVNHDSLRATKMDRSKLSLKGNVRIRTCAYILADSCKRRRRIRQSLGINFHRR